MDTPPTRISSRNAAKLMGVSTRQFWNIAATGVFGRPITYSDEPRVQRYFVAEQIHEYIRQREAVAVETENNQFVADAKADQLLKGII